MKSGLHWAEASLSIAYHRDTAASCGNHNEAGLEQGFDSLLFYQLPWLQPGPDLYLIACWAGRACLCLLRYLGLGWRPSDRLGECWLIVLWTDDEPREQAGTTAIQSPVLQ